MCNLHADILRIKLRRKTPGHFTFTWAFAHLPAKLSTTSTNSKPPCRSLMTTLAGREIVAAECALAVVAARTTERARQCVVIQRRGRRHLPANRKNCPDPVTCSTRQLLRCIMTRVTESNSIRRCLLGRANQTPELMAGAARGNVASVCLCVRRVTAKTGDVRIQS